MPRRAMDAKNTKHLVAPNKSVALRVACFPQRAVGVNSAAGERASA
ncbi:hypothetical protein MES4922_160245 [Mesorhizobium ventifaucium]|uniref:Uncharacterized protein n=1 Tax=Mesorhizobium ventifaucium TaxID=666020 RepID=A0ABM9DIM6_9HYPH|nr:hypothetical protein MES4922_160245 [Mesorhizobium ventifaucium]